MVHLKEVRKTGQLVVEGPADRQVVVEERDARDTSSTRQRDVVWKDGLDTYRVRIVPKDVELVHDPPLENFP